MYACMLAQADLHRHHNILYAICHCTMLKKPPLLTHQLCQLLLRRHMGCSQVAGAC
jgi:hypothetical protein